MTFSLANTPLRLLSTNLESTSQLNNTQFSLLVNAVKDYAIFMLDEKGYVASWNPGAERIKGYKADEIIGKHFSCFYPPEDLATHKPERALSEAATVGRFEDINWRLRKDGTRFWAHVIITPVLTQSDTLIGFAKVTRDLTEIHQNTQALQDSNERFRILVESVSDYAIYLLDPEGNVASWNRGAERIKGYKADEILGKNFAIFYLPEDLKENKPANQLKEAATLGRVEDEGWRVRKDGTHFWASAVITALYDSKAQITGFAKVTRDLTERKEAELQLADSNTLLRALSERLDKSREEERQRLAYQIQEEVGTALSTLKIELFRLRRLADAGNSAAVAERLGELNMQIDDIIWETRRIAMNARPAMLEDLGLLPAIEWQLQEFQRTSNIQCKLDSNINRLPLSPTQTTTLFRVLQELLNNVARHAQATEVNVWVEQRPTDLLFQVRDNGRGITPSESSAPTSLGLAGLRERVRLLNGDLKIEGETGKGTVVSITIPTLAP